MLFSNFKNYKLFLKTKDKFLFDRFSMKNMISMEDEQWRNIKNKTKENIYLYLSVDNSLELWSQLLIFPG